MSSRFALARAASMVRPGDELLAHDLDRRGDRLADDRLADPPRQPHEPAGRIVALLLVQVDEAAGQHEAPCRGIDEHAVRMRPGAGPSRRRSDLLGDQPVARLRIRRTEQRLSQAHEGEPFLGAERKLLQEAQPRPVCGATCARRSPAPSPASQYGGVRPCRSGAAPSNARTACASSRYLMLSRLSQSIAAIMGPGGCEGRRRDFPSLYTRPLSRERPSRNFITCTISGHSAVIDRAALTSSLLFERTCEKKRERAMSVDAIDIEESVRSVQADLEYLAARHAHQPALRIGRRRGKHRQIRSL